MTDKSETRSGLLDAEFMSRLERLAIASKAVKLGVTKGERKSKRKGTSTDFADYRNYVQGDDLRHVDWNIYGRLNSLYLKLFQEQEDLTLHLLIDSSESMAFGSPQKLDFACRAAAALGYIALISYDRLSIEAFSHDNVQRLPLCRGRASVRKMMAFLEAVESGGATKLEDACRAYVTRNRSKGSAILFSDLFDEDGFEGALKRLQSSGSDLYVIHILAPEEMDPNLTGDLKLIDSETEAFAEVSVSRTLMRRYHRNRQGFSDEVRKYCMARDIGYFIVPSDTPLEHLTLNVLRRGGMVR